MGKENIWERKRRGTEKGLGLVRKEKGREGEKWMGGRGGRKGNNKMAGECKGREKIKAGECKGRVKEKGWGV